MSDEDIRRLVPPPAPVVHKPPLYRSQYPGSVDPRQVPCSALGVKEIRSKATMGPGSGEELVSASRFLKAHEKEPQLPQARKPPPKQHRKAPIPSRDDKPAMGLSSGKNFVQSNVQEATLIAAKKHQEPGAAAEEVRYVFKPHFGELPPYLQQRKKELEAAREAAACAQQPQDEDDGAQVISGEALAELIRHLNLKWQSVNEAYQRLPCVLDTPSKRRRKEELEAQLAEIEQDVKMLSKASVVRIAG